MSTFCYWLVARIFSINDKISNLLRTRTHHSIPLNFANVIKFGSQVAYHQRRGTGIQTKISKLLLDYCIPSCSRHSTDTMLAMYPWLSHLDFPDVFFFIQCQALAPMNITTTMVGTTLIHGPTFHKLVDLVCSLRWRGRLFRVSGGKIQ